MKSTALFLSGVVFTLAAVGVPLAVSQPLAAYVSQRIYDCGVRVASDGVDIHTAPVSGHWYGICVDSGVTGFSLGSP